jgi:hypothetical protein
MNTEMKLQQIRKGARANKVVEAVRRRLGNNKRDGLSLDPIPVVPNGPKHLSGGAAAELGFGD